MSDRANLELELFELRAANEKATSWGAAVGARSERINDIESELRRMDSSTGAPQVLDREALATLVYEAIRFSDWAAGQSISPAVSQPALDPVDFINAYGEATGVWHDEKLAEHVRGLIVAPPVRSAATSVPAGYVLMPVIPTAAMIAEGCLNNPTTWINGTPSGFAADVANDVYVSMVRAAPTTSPEIPDNSAVSHSEIPNHSNCSKSSNGSPEPDAVMIEKVIDAWKAELPNNRHAWPGVAETFARVAVAALARNDRQTGGTQS